MTQWEYDKVDLNYQSKKADELDLLNDAGLQGWELVAITANNIAVLKRQLPAAPAAKSVAGSSLRQK